MVGSMSMKSDIMYSDIGRTITPPKPKLSELEIDVDKDWLWGDKEGLGYLGYIYRYSKFNNSRKQLVDYGPIIDDIGGAIGDGDYIWFLGPNISKYSKKDNTFCILGSPKYPSNKCTIISADEYNPKPTTKYFIFGCGIVLFFVLSIIYYGRKK